jgi:biotin operon repressor
MLGIVFPAALRQIEAEGSPQHDGDARGVGSHRARMRRLERLVAIALFFGARRRVLARDVAEKFGVSLRTVYRDVRALVEAGFPVDGTPGDGYRLPQASCLRPLALTGDEAEVLTIAARVPLPPLSPPPSDVGALTMSTSRWSLRDGSRRTRSSTSPIRRSARGRHRHRPRERWSFVASLPQRAESIAQQPHVRLRSQRRRSRARAVMPDEFARRRSVERLWRRGVKGGGRSSRALRRASWAPAPSALAPEVVPRRGLAPPDSVATGVEGRFVRREVPRCRRRTRSSAIRLGVRWTI